MNTVFKIEDQEYTFHGGGSAVFPWHGSQVGNTAMFIRGFDWDKDSQNSKMPSGIKGQWYYYGSKYQREVSEDIQLILEQQFKSKE